MIQRRGFTLVELLVVIAIIGILIALLLPAVQAAREAARRVQCVNHLKQMAQGCLTHVDAQGHFPTGGWGWGWAGEPDRGFGKTQPGGWHYNILPFCEMKSLHRMGTNNDRVTGRDRTETPVAMFICPTRRAVKAYPYVHGSPYYNIERPRQIGRSDYAHCGGDGAVDICDKGPSTIDAARTYAFPTDDVNNTGIIMMRSMIRPKDVLDGASHTYLIGEKYLSPDCYPSGVCGCDDQGWDLAYDHDGSRWGNYSEQYRPLRDRPGYDNWFNFGSAHATVFNMAMGDGSVHSLSYEIEMETHRRLSSRSDRRPVSIAGL